MQLAINHWVHIDKHSVIKDNSPLLSFNEAAAPEEVYRSLQYNYIKFFKMDVLCKWAWLSAEALLIQDGAAIYDGLDKTKIAVVMMTSHGCIEVDKKYQESTATIASPALFVYTLPNIMLGEICIRHGFKGEQACLVNGSFDAEQMHFWVSDLLQNRGMDACLCGWVDATVDGYSVTLYWVSREQKGIQFNATAMQQINNRTS